MRISKAILLMTMAGATAGCGDTKIPGDAPASGWTGFDSILDPLARTVMPMSGIASPTQLGLHVQPLDDDGTLTVLYSAIHDGAFVDATSRSESVFAPPKGLVSYVNSRGKVTAFDSPPSLLHAVNSTFTTSPYSTALNGGALVGLCSTSDIGARTNYYYVDTSARTLEEVTGLPVDALCVTGSNMPLTRVGRGLAPGNIIVGSVMYSIEGGTATAVQGFDTPGASTDPSFYNAVAWVEEIDSGVFARVVVSFSFSGAPWTISYGRSDQAAAVVADNDTLPLGPFVDLGGYFDVTGRIVREASGSLLYESPISGVYRWNVESDGSVEKLAEIPAAPSGTWSEAPPTGPGQAVSLRLVDDPYDLSVKTPAATAARELDFRAVAYASGYVRHTPCLDDAECFAVGETYTLGLLGSAAAPYSVQLLWPWELTAKDEVTNTSGNQAEVVVVPAHLQSEPYPTYPVVKE